MEWVEGLRDALRFIEENIYEDISIEDIAKSASISTFYFHKGFTMLCGLTLGEYIRGRRLTLAGSELALTDKKVIDIALEHGYSSPDSFTKAFTRFHGVTPTAVRKEGAEVKMFAPLKIKFSLEGGYIMDYRIMEKDSFTIIGFSKMVKYDESTSEVPKFWRKYCDGGKSEKVCGKYGVSISREDKCGKFEYIISEDYSPEKEVAEGLVTRVIPKHTWAVFPCKGPMPKAIQDVQKKIFAEWFPNNSDYEVASGYNVEMYTDTDEYAQGNDDPDYYTEVWVPVKRK